LIERQHGELCYLQFNHYRQFPELIHGIFTRAGGYSAAPYRGLNTSTSLKIAGADSVDNVARNRQLVLQALAIENYPCVTLWQIHSADVAIFDARDEWRTDWAYHSYYERTWTPTSIHKGDALITTQRGIAIAFSFADCAPILLYDPVKQAIGIAHGGWRGTARGIAAATIAAMQEHFGCQPDHIYAGIGPAIGPCCYEVSEAVRQLFTGQLQFDERPVLERYRAIVRDSAQFSTLQLAERTSLRLDLRETNRRQLLMMGLTADHIEVAGICTCCQRERFFSHRGEHGKTGRFPAVIALHS
jgi:YfiH family protein